MVRKIVSKHHIINRSNFWDNTALRIIEYLFRSISLLLVSVFSGCHELSSKDESAIDLNISASKWSIDTLGCTEYRKNNYKILLKNKNAFIGRPSGDIIELLGLPNHRYELGVSKNMLVYVVECTMAPPLKNGLSAHDVVDSRRGSYERKDVATLVFDLKQGVCVNVRIMIP